MTVDLGKRGLDILLAEKDQALLSLASGYLESVGLVVVPVATPTIAYLYLSQRSYDVVVCSDGYDSLVSGVDLCKGLRGQGNPVPFILYTDCSLFDVGPVLEAEVSDVVMKWQPLEDLAMAVMKYG